MLLRFFCVLPNEGSGDEARWVGEGRHQADQNYPQALADIAASAHPGIVGRSIAANGIDHDHTIRPEAS
jgi:hypothetical protein